MKRNFSNLKTVVVKLGTSIMTDARGRISRRVLERIVYGILALKKRFAVQVVVVSSGAIGLGMETLGLKKRPKDNLAALQACAAVGQGKLMRLYEEIFSRKGFHTAQVLLTRSEFEERTQYLNASRTFAELLRRGVIPIVNENDTVATQEIQFGDNDTLAALVALLLKADLTILLSDIAGFFLKDGSLLKQAVGAREIEKLKGHLYSKNREHTVGGMATKLRAAKMLAGSGHSLLIADGRDHKILARILKGEEVGTLFTSAGRQKVSRDSWLTHRRFIGSIGRRSLKGEK